MQLSPEGKQLVKSALTAKAWTLEDLAQRSLLSLPTIKNFSSGKPVSRITFVKLCEQLGVDWRVASGQLPTYSETQDRLPDPSKKPASTELDDALIQQVREHCRQKILNQHSRMRLLSGEEIGVDQLYVDVWLLNRSPRTFRVSESKLLETFDLRNDRLGLGDRIRRNPGFKVAEANTKLLILGKPGAGKTTFLKHLAVDWCHGKFQPDSITVLIELRQVQDNQWNLLDKIDQDLGLGDWKLMKVLENQIQGLKQTPNQKEKNIQIEELQQQLEALPLLNLLKQGKLMVLIDGLDEVPSAELRCEVQKQLQESSEEYSKNRFVLTCRTQVIGSIPGRFASVEVADFNEEQVEQFVRNWFRVSGQSNTEIDQQWEELRNVLHRNLSLKELVVTPVLLSLVCLVFQDEGEMPSEMTWLYQKGIRLLLNKWNDAKEIAGWEVGTEAYRELNIEQKEALLIKISAHKFKNPRNFILFEQAELAKQITQFLQLSSFQEGLAVLKAIEAQHGLLIERADELWSFSHLTFQEYFTIQWLTQLPAEHLAEMISTQHWQGVTKQLVKSQQPADRLLRLSKQALDLSIANQPLLQDLLVWVAQKSESIQTNSKPVALRAFYIALVFARANGHDLDRNRDIALAFARDLDGPYALAFAHDLTLDLTLDCALALAHKRILALSSACALARNFDSTSELLDKLERLRIELPSVSIEDRKTFEQWWQVNGSQWTEQLRQVMIEHRNIGHDWQFDEAQKQQLQQYYDANQFLVELMKIEGAVSDHVRTEIEDTLLLPIEELQRRQPGIYGQHNRE